MSWEGIRTAIGVLQYANQRDQQNKENAFNDEVALHEKMFMQNPNGDYIPKGDFDGRAYMTAKAAVINNKLQQQSVQQNVFQEWKNQMVQGMKEGQDAVNSAANFASIGQYGVGIKTLIDKAYGNHILPDGGTAVVEKTPEDAWQLSINYANGSKDVIGTYHDQKELYNTLYQRAKTEFYNPNQYAQTWMAMVQKNVMTNNLAFQNATTLYNQKGEPFTVVKGLVVARSGMPLDDPKQHVEKGIQILDQHSGKYISVEEAIKRGVTLTEADINAKKEAAAKLAQSRKPAARAISTMEADYNYFKRTNPKKSPKEIAQMVAEHQTSKDKTKAYYQFIKEHSLEYDLDTAEGWAKLNRVFDNGWKHIHPSDKGVPKPKATHTDITKADYIPTQKDLDIAKKDILAKAQKVGRAKAEAYGNKKYPWLLAWLKSHTKR